jgi:hypothetical protein
VSDADFWEEIMTERNVLQYHDTTGELGVTYDYRVIANGLAGPSEPSVIATAQFPSQPLDKTPPTVVITTPADGAEVSGNVPVEATFGDDGVGLQYVEVSVSQGSSTANICSRSPGGVAAYTLSCTWRTKRVSPGTYTLTAYAYDSLGNWAQQSVTVTLMDGGGNGGGGGGKGGGKGKPSRPVAARRNDWLR